MTTHYTAIASQLWYNEVHICWQGFNIMELVKRGKLLLVVMISVYLTISFISFALSASSALFIILLLKSVNEFFRFQQEKRVKNL